MFQLSKKFLIIGLMTILCVGIWAAEEEEYERKPAVSCVVPEDVLADTKCAIERMEPLCRRLLDPGTYADDFRATELSRQINSLLTERVILEEGDEKLTQLQQRPGFKDNPTRQQSLLKRLNFYHQTHVLSEQVIDEHPEIDPNYIRTLISQFLVLGQLGKLDYPVEERPAGKTPWRKPELGNPLEVQCAEHGFPLLPQTLVCAQEVAKFLNSNPKETYSRFRFPLLLEDLNRSFISSTFSPSRAWDDPDLNKTELLEDLGYEPAWDFFRFNILYTLLKTTDGDLQNAALVSAGLNVAQDVKLLQKILFAKAILDHPGKEEALQAMGI